MSRSGALYALTNVANTFTQPQTINSPTVGAVPLTIQLLAGQTGDALDVLSSTSVKLVNLDSGGNVITANSLRTIGAVIGGQDVFVTDAPTIPSANTIAPTTPAAFVSGTTVIKTITPTAAITGFGSGVIILIPTGLWTTDLTGNIALASVAIVNKPITFVYSVSTGKWYPSY